MKETSKGLTEEITGGDKVEKIPGLFIITLKDSTFIKTVNKDSRD